MSFDASEIPLIQTVYVPQPGKWGRPLPPFKWVTVQDDRSCLSCLVYHDKIEPQWPSGMSPGELLAVQVPNPDCENEVDGCRCVQIRSESYSCDECEEERKPLEEAYLLEYLPGRTPGPLHAPSCSKDWGHRRAEWLRTRVGRKHPNDEVGIHEGPDARHGDKVEPRKWKPYRKGKTKPSIFRKRYGVEVSST